MMEVGEARGGKEGVKIAREKRARAMKRQGEGRVEEKNKEGEERTRRLEGEGRRGGGEELQGGT